MASSLGAIANLYGVYQAAKGEKSTMESSNSTCHRLIDSSTFYYWILLPSIGIIITLMFFVKRTQLLPNILGGRPAILIPMNFLDDRGLRLSYAAVFGLTASMCMRMIQQEYPIPIAGPGYIRVLVKLGTMFLYGFALYPLLAALTMGTVLSFGLGTLYIWMFWCVKMVEMTDCADDYAWEFYMQNVFLPTIPELICSTFLAVSFPYRFVRKLVRKIRQTDRHTTQVFFEDSYKAKYVSQLLRPPSANLEEAGMKKRLKAKVKSMTYEKVSGFRYSPRILATYASGIILLFLIAFQFFSFLVLILRALLMSLSMGIDPAETRSLNDVYENVSLQSFTTDPSGAFMVLHHLFHTLLVIICLSLTLVCLIGIVQIALGLRAYKDDLLNAYMGDFSKVGPRENYSSLLEAFVRYSGYQVAYIFWAFMLQFIVIFIVLAILAYVIFIPIIYNRAMWFLDKLIDYWPVLLITLSISILSRISAKYIFLQQRGQIFALDNRRFLFSVMYFLFFYNVLVGFFSCLIRMIKSLIFGLFFLSRLDSSTLPKRFELMDPGFKAYVGLIHVENAHTHPVVVTFVNMVQEALQTQRDREKEERRESYHKIKDNAVAHGGELGSNSDVEREAQKKITRRRKAMKSQWFLAYTLINNMPLRATRKHYMDAEKERMEKRLKRKVPELATEAKEASRDTEMTDMVKDPSADPNLSVKVRGVSPEKNRTEDETDFVV